jgi:hypothetical protein
VPRRPLALAVLLGACAGPPPPLAIDARFDGAKALILGIAEADATRWYGIDLESGAGIEDVPPIVVRDAERVTLYANVSTEPSARILSRPGLLDTSQLDVGQPLPPGLMSFERELSMSSTGSWIPRATPPAVRSPNFLSPSECPRFTVGPAVELVGATEPVSAAARLPNGQVLLFTGRTFEGDPGAPYQLGSWNYTLATRRVAETQPMSLSAMKAEKLRVAAAIPVGDELILGAQRPVGQGEDRKSVV